MTDWVVEGVGGGGGTRDDSLRSSSSFFLFSARGPCEQFWHGQGCPLLVVVHPAFPLPTTASPSLHGALKDGFGEAVVTSDMPKPLKFPYLDRCQKRFLWIQVDLARQEVRIGR